MTMAMAKYKEESHGNGAAQDVMLLYMLLDSLVFFIISTFFYPLLCINLRY